MENAEGVYNIVMKMKLDEGEAFARYLNSDVLLMEFNDLKTYHRFGRYYGISRDKDT
ncbi:44169_t:CDS:2, partial [Gigaspora margarita]